MKILIGFLIFFTSTFLVPVTQMDLMERQVEKRLKNVIKQSIKYAYITKNYDLTIIVKPWNKRVNGSYVLTNERKCEVVIEVNEDGSLTQVLLSGNDDFDLANDKERDLHDKFIVLHETSHCLLKEIVEKSELDIIKIKNNKALEKKVNYYYKNSSQVPFVEMKDVVNKISLRGVVEEAFADSYAIIQLIREEKDEKTLKNIIVKLEYHRYKYELYRKFHSEEIFSHSTHYVFKEILKEKNIKLIKNAKKSELVNLALEFANDSVGSLINNNNIDYVLDNFVIIMGSVNLLKKYRMHENIIKKYNIQYEHLLLINEKIKNGEYKNLQEENLDYNRIELGRLGYYLYDLLEDDKELKGLKEDLFNYYDKNFKKNEMYEIKTTDDKDLNFKLYEKRLLIEKEKYVLKLKELN